jgi:hypothetical protein
MPTATTVTATSPGPGDASETFSTAYAPGSRTRNACMT